MAEQEVYEVFKTNPERWYTPQDVHKLVDIDISTNAIRSSLHSLHKFRILERREAIAPERAWKKGYFYRLGVQQ